MIFEPEKGEPKMKPGKTLSTVLMVLAIMYLVPFLIYGVYAVVTGDTPPQDDNFAATLIGLILAAASIAVPFVLLFQIAHESLSGRWLVYAAIWLILTALADIGYAIGPSYSWQQAMLGIISAMIYLPLSALITDKRHSVA
jgi:membrane associated rhomboid family serine protease